MRLFAAALAAGRAVLALLIGYLTVLTGAAWFATARDLLAPRRRRPDPTAEARYAFVVPAHDEEHVIASTLDALRRLDWPVDRYEVHVVADHCTDRTVELAKAAGAVVHEHIEHPRGKGPALQWALSRVLDPEVSGAAPHAVVIVDADTVVDSAFLRAIDAAFADGALVVQGQYRVRDPGSSPAAGLRAAALALRHHLRPLGRTTLGASCGLYGNGMAFRSEILRRREWSGHLTEDLELQMELLLDGVLVAYAPRAIVEAEMPSGLEAARTQNERWERGRIDLARRYVPALVDMAKREPGRRAAAVDGVLDHLVPPLSVLAAATGGVAVAGSAVALLRRRGLRRSGWTLLGALGWHVGSGLVLARAPWSVYRSLLGAPAMVWWKVRLWSRMLRHPGAEGWARTAREGAR